MPTPNIALDLDYRYLRDDRRHLPRAVGAEHQIQDRLQHPHADGGPRLHRFGPPPAPPVAAPPLPAAPPVAQRRVFLVFFDWDKATITPEGMQIVQQAADVTARGAPVQLQVTGLYRPLRARPATTSGCPSGAPPRVAAALAGLGVLFADQMSVSGRGENDNRVPTADGVREPQNRRVEIVAS